MLLLLRLLHLLLRLLRLFLQAQCGDLIGVGAVEGDGFGFDAEDRAVEFAAGGDEGVDAGCGGGLGDDGVLFGGAEFGVGGVDDFAVVVGVVGLVVAHGGERVVGLDVLERLGRGDAGFRVDVVHAYSILV